MAPRVRPHASVVLALVLVTSIAGGSAARAAETAFRGRPLGEALRVLQGRGLTLIYSTAMVDEAALVTVEPREREPRALLAEILAPLGLQARDGPGGSILIIRRPSPAPEPEEALRHRFVDQVVVTPSRVSVVQQEQSVSQTVLDPDSVLAPSFGGDVSRVVELLPGVAAPDNSAAFNVRGSLSADVSIVLDGLELYDPYHLLDFQSPFSFVDTGIVERIDVLGGPFTAELGDRHGGVVSISTQARTDPHNTRIGLGSLNSWISHGGPLPGGGSSWLVSARAWYPQALHDSIEIGESGLDPRFEDAYLRFTFSPSARLVLSAHSLVAYDRINFDEPGGGETVDATSRSAYVWLRALGLWRPGLVSDAVLSGGRIDRTRRGLSEPEDVLLDVVDERDVDFFGFRDDVSWTISDRHVIKAGLDVRRLDADYRYRSGPASDPAGQVSRERQPAGTSASAYAAYRAGIGANLATEAGVRWDRQGHTGQAETSPRLNAVLSLGERSELRIGVGQFYQSQRIHELRIEDGQTRFLPAELAREAGVTFQTRLPRDLVLRLDAYYRWVSSQRPRSENLFNPIELYPETEDDRVLVTAESARLRGVEIFLHTSPGRRFDGWISYALSSAEDFDGGRGVPRSWDQTHAVKFLAGYRVADRWTVSLSGTGHTGWPTTPVSAVATPLPGGGFQIDPVRGPRNSARFPTYIRLDLKTTRTFATPSGSLRLDLELLNLTNRDNPCCVDDFSYSVRANGSVDVDPHFDEWLGATPTLRLVWEF